MSDSTGGMSDLDDMDNIKMIMQQLQSEQEQAAESSHHRNYIYREREDAEERLMADYFGAHPKYLLYYFQKQYRMSRKLFLEIVADRKYPLSKEACLAMLKMKLLDGKMDEVCYQLLKMIEKQAGIRKIVLVVLGKQVRFSFVSGFKKSDCLEYKVSNDDTAVVQRRLKDKQPEEKTNTDCLVKEQEKVNLGIKVGVIITVTGVPGQEGVEGKYVRSGCTTALNVVPWETDGESVLREAMTNTIVTTPVNVTGTPVTNTVANHAEKLEKFNGQNFKRWQQKMFFYLETLNLARFLNETAPQVETS
ncbi:hypothetical protein Tco_1556785 [Tanacetum coccineum]